MRWARSAGFARQLDADEQPSGRRNHGYSQGSWRTRLRRADGVALPAANRVAICGGTGTPGRRDMRAELCTALVRRSQRPDMVFLTGDLGFMALEPLRDSLGDRFINCGVAEQNMVTVAAGLAKEGLDVWVYSIAPFCYARAFE